MALEAVDLLAVERRLVLAGARGCGLEAERAADPLHVDPDHARALAAAPERGDREPRQVAHLAVAALGDRLADRLAQLVEVEALAALVALALADPAVERLGLGGAEEEAVEEELEDAAVLLGLGDRRGERLAEVVLAVQGTASSAANASRISERADRDPLAAQLLAEGDEPRREARSA